jgi:hypothetical protein
VVTPTYHDLHITTATIPRTSIFSLPYTLEVHCTRVTGWQLWRIGSRALGDTDVLLAGEYAGPDEWLVLDVAGHVILDSREIERGDDE